VNTGSLAAQRDPAAGSGHPGVRLRREHLHGGMDDRLAALAERDPVGPAGSEHGAALRVVVVALL